ncbi:SNF2-related protein [Nocardia beijingensis]|uniref:SNF2-related protein n=1 Tax=Nocardia beijingensis TaxID=95162 RepID=A0ABW7WCD3_9NOCA
MTPPVATVFVEDASLVAAYIDDGHEEQWYTVKRWLAAQGFESVDGCVRVTFNQSHKLMGCLDTAPANQFSWELTAEAAAVIRGHSQLTHELDEIMANPEMSNGQWPDDLGEPSTFGFRRTLTAEQHHDVARLLAMRHGGNFGVPGSGKTTVAYCVWAAERARDQVDALLVIAPLAAFEAWTGEPIECFVPEARPRVHVMPGQVPHSSDVVVMSYSRLTQLRTVAELDSWLTTRRTMLVFDESHRVKAGPQGAWGRAAARLARRCHRRYVLSGTPMPNTTSDLAAQLDLCWPGYGAELANGSLRGVRDRIYVRTTKEQLRLPKLSTRVERVPLEPMHQKIYDALAGGAMNIVNNPRLAADVEMLGAVLMRLLAAATNPAAVLSEGQRLELPSWVDQEAPIDEIVRNTARMVRPAKLMRSAQLVEANVMAGRKTLVWSVFVANVTAMADLLAAHEPAVITGALPTDDPNAPTDRNRELRRFRTDPNCKVLVATPQTLGEGVSLHRTCVDQIHLDRTFNAGLYLQSLDRTHRLGMDKASNPTVTVLLADQTIDLSVHHALNTKVRNMSNVLNDPNLARMQLPDFDESLELRDVLLDGDASTDDLRELLRRVRGF